MHTIGRIKLPNSTDICSLYIQCNDGAFINYTADCQEIVLDRAGNISSNSYFNSFYEKFYAKYTTLESVYYLLKLEGDFQISIYREVDEVTNRQLIAKENYEKCQASEHVKILLPDLFLRQTTGRIYFEIICLSERGLFKGGLIATEQTKNREVSLGIITCTFKKESYIKNTVSAILQDKFLQTKDLKIFVVDNGKTLNENDFKDSRVQLIFNKNVGESGGFTRGLIEALQLGTYSHFLFMDDDIELDSESIYRLFSLYEYARTDFAVAGSMLDLHKKHVLYEAGAFAFRPQQSNLYNKSGNKTKFSPFSIASAKHKFDLKDNVSLNLLLLEEEIDYGAFWFFSVPKEFIEEIGLPMPFFIKVDDIEFGLRIKKRLGNKIVAFPSIAVWHEPFYSKFPIWDIYYIDRNYLITHAIHGSLGYMQAIKHTTESLILALLVFNYNSAEMLVKAFDDYLKGPDFIKAQDPESLHSNILKLSKSYKNQNLQQNYSPPYQFKQNSRTGSLKKLISLLTLNGHFLPNCFTSNDDAFIWRSPGYPGQVSKAFGKKRVLLFMEESSYLFQNEIDKLAGIRILAKWFKVVLKSSTKWSLVSVQWKHASKEMTSTKFWQQYLRL